MALTSTLEEFHSQKQSICEQLAFFSYKYGMTANVCWPNCHDRRLSILYHFSPTKCSWKPSNDDSYVFTKKCLPCLLLLMTQEVYCFTFSPADKAPS